jgi:hypothetical protein
MLTLVTAATTHDLTRVETAATELLLTRAEDLAALPENIQKASAACASYCGRQEGFGRATWRQTERLSFARDYIILDRDIAPTITSVVEGADTLAGTDYELDGALLYRLDADERTMWPAEKIVITYAAGFLSGGTLGDLPHEIERACLLTMAAMIDGRGHNPALQRENDGLVSFSYAEMPGGIPPQAAALLAPYRRLML